MDDKLTSDINSWQIGAQEHSVFEAVILCCALTVPCVVGLVFSKGHFGKNLKDGLKKLDP